MAIAIDASSPAAVTGGATITTASFTPPSNAILLAVGADYQNGSPGTITSSPSLTWTNIVTSASNDAARLSYAVVSSSASMTVTRSGGNNSVLQVLVLTGADTSTPINASHNTAFNGSAISDSVTTTADHAFALIAASCDPSLTVTPGTGVTTYLTSHYRSGTSSTLWIGYVLDETPAGGKTLTGNASSGTAFDVVTVALKPAAAPTGVTSTGAVALAPSAVAASGAETYAAVGTVSLESLAISGTGAETFAAAGSAALAPVTATGAGDVTNPVTSNGSIVLAPITVQGAGVGIIVGTGSASLAPLTLAGSGTNTPPGVTGSGSVTLAPVAASGAGAVGVAPVASTGAVALAPLAAAGAGVETFTSTGSVAQAPLAVAGAGVVPAVVIASGSVALSPLAALAFQVQPSVTCTGRVTLASLAVVAYVRAARDITVTATLAPSTWSANIAPSTWSAVLSPT